MLPRSYSEFYIDGRWTPTDSTETFTVISPSTGEVIGEVPSATRADIDAAVEAARPGVSAESVDAAARDILVEHGLGDRFIHRTGHGIGLSVHEEPYIVGGNTITLRPGMAFSVEPGVYFPGRWGARIEDIVVITDDGCEPVNTRPHGLVTL